EQQIGVLEQASELVKSNLYDVPKRIEGLLAQAKESAREIESLRAKLASIEAGSLTDQVKELNGIRYLAAKVNVADMDALRTMADQMKAKLPSAVIVLGAGQDDKVNLVASVSQDLVAKGYHAGKLI